MVVAAIQVGGDGKAGLSLEKKVRIFPAAATISIWANSTWAAKTSPWRTLGVRQRRRQEWAEARDFWKSIAEDPNECEPAREQAQEILASMTVPEDA